MTCHFCNDKPRDKPFWIQLGTNGPWICGGHHYQNAKELTEIDRVIEQQMQKVYSKRSIS